MDPITFNLRNAKGAAAAYISTNPADNALTLIVTNTTGGDLKLQAGAPVAEPPPANGPSSLYLNFGDLVPAAAAPLIKIAADGWQAQYFATPSPAFALTPTQNLTFASQTSLNFEITNFPVAGPARPGSVSIDYYGLGDIAPSSSAPPVMIESPPSANKTLNLNSGIVDKPVAFITVDDHSPIQNTLVLYLSNPSSTAPIVGDSAPWGPNPPVFIISFVPGAAPGYGALTTLDRMKDMEIGLAQVYQDQWAVTKDVSGPKPLWRLTPKAHEILGTGEAATVEFRITNLVTELHAGMTSLYVQYSNIPGYDDGYMAFPIEKQMPRPGILQFISLTPIVIKRGDPVTLAWQTFDAQTLTLSFASSEQSNSLEAPNEIPFNGGYSPAPPPTDTLTYTLQASDFAGNTVQSQVTVTVIEPAPRITYFVASPSVANLVDGGAINLYWQVTNVFNIKQLTLTYPDSSGAPQTAVLPLSSTQYAMQVHRSGGVAFTLSVDSQSDPNYHQEASVTVPTWDDLLTLASAPAGTVLPFSGAAANLAKLQSQGWLKCDGGSVSKNAYPHLYDVIGTTYGGDGNPNFALPDLRGYFLRGVDDSAGRDPDAASRARPGRTAASGVGTTQGDQLVNHCHYWDHFFFKRSWSGGDIAVHQPPSSPNLQNNKAQATNHDGGGSETRPKNVYVYYLIATGAGA